MYKEFITTHLEAIKAMVTPLIKADAQNCAVYAAEYEYAHYEGLGNKTAEECEFADTFNIDGVDVTVAVDYDVDYYAEYDEVCYNHFEVVAEVEKIHPYKVTIEVDGDVCEMYEINPETKAVTMVAA